MENEKLTIAEAIMLSQELMYQTKFIARDLNDILHNHRHCSAANSNKELKELAKKVRPEYHECYEKLVSDFINGVIKLVDDVVTESIKD